MPVYYQVLTAKVNTAPRWAKFSVLCTRLATEPETARERSSKDSTPRWALPGSKRRLCSCLHRQVLVLQARLGRELSFPSLQATIDECLRPTDITEFGGGIV